MPEAVELDPPDPGGRAQPRERTRPEVVRLERLPEQILAGEQLAPLLREHEGEIVVSGLPVIRFGTYVPDCSIGDRFQPRGAVISRSLRSNLRGIIALRGSPRWVRAANSDRLPEAQFPASCDQHSELQSHKWLAELTPQMDRNRVTRSQEEGCDMPSDFTVIQAVRQRFGDATADLAEIAEEQEAPFVGQSKEFPFSCPNVIPGETAILQFETLAVSAGQRQGLARNILPINGVNIPGGITAGATVEVQGRRLPYWKAHLLTVAPNVLREQNVLRIEAVNIPFGPGQTLDNFVVDNIVVFFKIRTQPVLGG